MDLNGGRQTEAKCKNGVETDTLVGKYPGTLARSPPIDLQRGTERWGWTEAKLVCRLGLLEAARDAIDANLF